VTPLEQVLDRLHGVRASGDGYTARCPAHDDRHQSLSVGAGQSRAVVLNCHACGASPDNIVVAAGLDPRDILGARSNGAVVPVRASKTEASRPAVVSRTTYRVEGYEHVRLELDDGSKSFFWRHDGRNELPAGVKGEDLLYGAEQLAELPDGATLALCEGEKAADALRAAGIPAVASTTGAAGTPSEASLRRLLRFDVVLWADNDQPGRGHMQRTAERLQALGQTPRWVVWEAAPAKGDAADASPTERSRLISEAVNYSQEVLPSGTTTLRLAPDVASETNGPAAPFPLDALPPALRRLVHEGAQALPCPPDFIAVPLLTAAGVAIGDAVELELKPGWREGANTTTAIVGDPGSKKTPALNLANGPLYRIQQELAAEYAEQKATFKREMAAWEATKKSERGEKPEPPVFPHLVTTDATVEALAPMLQSGKGILLSREELSGWVQSLNQYRSGGKGADRQAYLSMWSRTLLKIDRKTSPEPIVVPRPFVGINGGIQPDLLQGLADPQSREDGFVDRILWAYSECVEDTWTTECVARETIAAVDGLFRRLYALQGEPDPDSEDENAIRPRVIRLSAAAMTLWASWYRDQAAELAGEAFPSKLRGPWAKMPGQAARLALTLHCVERVAAGANPADTPLTDWALGSALDLIDTYFKPHCRRVYRLLTQQRRDHVVRLLEALKQSGPMLKREILLGVFNGNVAASRVDAMLEELEAAGLAVREVKHEGGAGRPGTWWRSA
jgi:hypothetical protein